MFETFTDRARKVMACANEEARQLKHEYIATEHILLGLLKEGTGVGVNVLKNLEVDLVKLRQAAIQKVREGDKPVAEGKLPLTPRAKKVIEHAIEESREINHEYVGTEHFVLGLIRERDGVAAHALFEMDLNLELVRDEVKRMLEIKTLNDNASSEVIAETAKLLKEGRVWYIKSTTYAILHADDTKGMISLMVKRHGEVSLLKVPKQFVRWNGECNVMKVVSGGDFALPPTFSLETDASRWNALANGSEINPNS